MIDYGRFAERLRAAAGRWDLLREFQEEWGYQVPEGVEPWPRDKGDAHKEHVRELFDAEPDSDVDPSLPIPAALDQWWDLPFNSFTHSPRLYWTHPQWPPGVRPDPAGFGEAEGLPVGNPFVGPEDDHRVCAFMAEYEHCNEWGYLAAEAGRDDPKVMVATEDGWRVQSRSISEFFLQLAVERVPAYLGWTARLDEGAFPGDAPIGERIAAAYPELGLLPWWEMDADAVAYGAPDAIVHHSRGGYVDFPVVVHARSRDALVAVLETLGTAPPLEELIREPETADGTRPAPRPVVDLGEIAEGDAEHGPAVLIEIAADPGDSRRGRCMELLTALVREDPGAVREGAAGLLPLLDDPDPVIRRAVPYLIACSGADHASAFQERFAAESDPGAAASLVLAVGRSAAASPLPWLADVLAGSPLGEVRAAAVVAMLECDVAEVDGFHFNTLSEQARAEESALDGLPWAAGGRDELLTSSWNESLAAHVFMADFMMLYSDDAEEFIRDSGEMMRGWRHVRAGLLEPMAAQLTDSNPGIRAAAVRELATMGPALAPVADALVPLLDDPDPRLAGGALDALARAGDARCLPALFRDLPYDVERAVAGLAGHAEEVVPLLRDRLDPEVLAGLRAWGSRAEPLVPALAGLIERGESVPEAAAVLGEVGPAAAPALPVLRAHQEHAEVAWACWRISGVADETLLRLRTLSGEDARRLFELGEAAAPAVPMLRTLADAGDRGAPCVLYRITGETGLLPRVVAALSGSPKGVLAVRALAERPPETPAPGMVARLEEIARGREVVAEAAVPDVVAADLRLRDLAAGVLRSFP